MQYTFPRDDDDDVDFENIHWNIRILYIFAEPDTMSTTVFSYWISTSNKISLFHAYFRN